MPPLTIGKCGIACIVVSMRRPSLESMLEDYWRLMPEYQNVDLSILQPLRILFGFFPTYRQVVIPSSSHQLTDDTVCESVGADDDNTDERISVRRFLV